MGLQSQLNDVSSDSIPLLLLALIAKSIDHLRSFFFSIFHSMALPRFTNSQSILFDEGLLIDSMGSGLSSLIVLAEQLNVNRLFSYRYRSCGGNDDNHNRGGAGAGAGGGGGSDCVVCLCALSDGDQVRKLDCRHVFHKDCFDDWLRQLKFNCPLCRSPLVSGQRVLSTRSRVAGDLVAWFSVR
ncbi:E3 ubiquitin-protein ligase RHA2A [Ricinus communis]|uniref:RING-type domain-containing protein n=1 Tax=Ricinus communis TaxID=3988 RepID=B9SJY5_RICCO|nr:E3 ubiquitin-protein ligase RHA2A [Ricinus communis]EEF36093.1 conserved hypothetical protein [Ricinus communis]|eukprot:XP_002526304.1 E3 ubiquitin-protein ligase RHA2A [Ricinus communis]